VRVSVYLERMYDESRQKAIEGLFTFVAIDDEMKPVAVRK
jgi:acyl-CoA hydrolase